MDYVVNLWTYAGDFSAALKTADLIQDVSFKNSAQINIVYDQAGAGDIVGAQKTLDLAQKTADLIRGAEDKSEARERYKLAVSSIAEARAKARSTTKNQIPAPGDFLAWLLQSLDGEYNTGPFLDLANYLTSLPSSGDPQKLFDALNETAANMVLAQKGIEHWLKLELKLEAKQQAMP